MSHLSKNNPGLDEPEPTPIREEIDGNLDGLEVLANEMLEYVEAIRKLLKMLDDGKTFIED